MLNKVVLFMKRGLFAIFASFFFASLYANDVYDVLNKKTDISSYIEEYKELKPVKQFEKFRKDCEMVAEDFTVRGAYYVVYEEPELLNVDSGLATYSIAFRLEEQKGIKELNNILTEIKESLPSLANSHLTPYDCEDLLPKGQYCLEGKDGIHIAVLNSTIATLIPRNIYIQFYIKFKGKVYSSESFYNSNEKNTITVPSECDMQNIAANFQSTYGVYQGGGSFFGAIMSALVSDLTNTPQKNSKKIYGKIDILSQAKFEEKKKLEEEKRLAEEEAARIAEEERLYQEAAARIAEEERVAQEKKEQEIKLRELINSEYILVCERFVSSLGGNNEDLNNISLEIKEDGRHIFNVPISFLAKNEINKEIIICNNTENNIYVLSIELQVKEKTHSCMNREWISSEHSVSGIYNKNISSEISKAFGVDGKFNKKKSK